MTSNQCINCSNVQPQGGLDVSGTRCIKCGGMVLPVAVSVPGPDSAPPTDQEIETAMGRNQSTGSARDDSHFYGANIPDQGVSKPVDGFPGGNFPGSPF